MFFTYVLYICIYIYIYSTFEENSWLKFIRDKNSDDKNCCPTDHRIFNGRTLDEESVLSYTVSSDSLPGQANCLSGALFVTQAELDCQRLIFINSYKKQKEKMK